MIGVVIAAKVEWNTLLEIYNIDDSHLEKYPYGEFYRTTFKNMSTNLSKSFETCNKILLDKISDENCLQSFYNFCEETINWQKMVLDEIRYL